MLQDEKATPKITGQQQTKQKQQQTKIEQPRNHIYFYAGCSALVLLLIFLALNKDYALNLLTTFK